jgi:predicted nucleic acid-binding protein
MTVILDASGAMEIALNRENQPAFSKVLKDADLVLAPNLYITEITNVFWKYAKFGNLDEVDCVSGIDFCINLVDDFIDTKDLWQEVFSTSLSESHSAYDMFYLISARRNNAILITCDSKLKAIAKKLKVKVSR